MKCSNSFLRAAIHLSEFHFYFFSFNFQIDEPEVQQYIRELVKPCIDFLMAHRFPSGNGPSSLKSKSEDVLVQWCHGAPGWVQLFALSYKVICQNFSILTTKAHSMTVIWHFFGWFLLRHTYSCSPP